MPDALRLVIRTPHAVVSDERVHSARVPTETGLVGLRLRQEPFILAVEPGLIVLRTAQGVRFAATAGGLLDGDRDAATLYTPFAVAGDDASQVLDALGEMLATPDSEIAARRRLGELEERIIQEFHHRPSVARARGSRA